MRLLIASALACALRGQLTLTPNATHLFLDGEGLAETYNISFALGDVRKEYSAPVVIPEHPWEESLHFYTSAVAVPAGAAAGVPAQFMLYYSCYVGGGPMYVCLAVSADGVAWAKPLTSAFPFSGADTNRVFLVNASSPGSWPGSVLLDAAAPAAERFKLTYEGAGGDRQLYMATSPDGVAWARRAPEVPIIAQRLFSDTQTAIVHDAARGRYLAFGREDSAIGPNASAGCNGNYPSLRRVLLATSTAGAAGPYSAPEQVLGPGFPDAYACLDIYNPAPIQVPGALLLLPSSFRHFDVAAAIPPFPPNATGFNDGVLDIRLAASRDGRAFSFVSRDAFVARGVGYRDPALGSFSAADSDVDAGFVFATAGGLVDAAALLAPAAARAPTPPFPFALPPARVSLLYFGTQRTHGGSTAHGAQAVLRATLRREGWAAARSPPGDPVGAAALVTAPLAVPAPASACGARGAQLWLLLNARTAVAGSVAVTLLAADARTPLPGFDAPVPFTGNAVRTPVGWARAGAGNVTNDLGALAGTTVVVRVDLVHAELFAWEVQCVVVA
jgi:hypothetical protein